MKTKRCRLCTCHKLVDQFNKNGHSTKTGIQLYSSECKECLAEARRDRRREKDAYNAEAVQAVRQKFADERAATRKKYAGKPVEKYITYVTNRDVFHVQIGGKVWGRYLTIEGAQKRKAEILSRIESGGIKQDTKGTISTIEPNIYFNKKTRRFRVKMGKWTSKVLKTLEEAQKIKQKFTQLRKLEAQSDA